MATGKVTLSLLISSSSAQSISESSVTCSKIIDS